MNVKTTMTMIIAMVAMISLTGLASAGTTMDYDVDFSGNGDGSVAIYTSSPVGTDVQVAQWTNCAATGHQSATYGNSKWLTVDRTTTITGLQNQQVASGSVATTSQMISPGSVSGGYVATVATYYDDAAYGSHVKLVQGTTLYDGDMVAGDTGYEYVDVDTEITGFAYGDTLTGVTGVVRAVTDGSLTASTEIAASVHDGRLRMIIDSKITDDQSDDETSRTTYNVKVRSPNDTADGFIDGYASVNGVTQNDLVIPFENADVTAVGYFYAVTL